MATLARYFRSVFSSSHVLQRTVCRKRLHPVAWVHSSKLLFDASGQAIKMPSLSPTMTSGTIVRWLKKEGDAISPGDVLCEIQTDKAVVAFEVEEEGILAKILVPDDTKDVQIGTVIGVMVEVGEDWKSAKIPTEEGCEPVAQAGGIPGIEIKMPSLSPTMTEGTIVKWLKREGDKIAPGDVLCEIQTDKAVVAFEMEEEGVLAKILVPDDTKNVKLGTVIALMVNEGEDWTKASVPSVSAGAQPPPTKEPEVGTAAAPPLLKHIEHEDLQKLCGPSVRLLLHEYGIKYSIVTPTGPHSVLLKSDVLDYIRKNKLKPKPEVPEAAISTVPDITFLEKESYIDIPHTSMRQVIARRMLESKTISPHAYMSIDCIVDDVTKLRNQLKKDGIPVSVNDFVIKCAAQSLLKVPELNVVHTSTGSKISESVDISVAVATDKGLITPIVKQANTLGIQQISECVKALSSRARENRLRPEEFQGGSFTISNLGMFGISEFTAVINQPQGAILAVGTSHAVFRNKSPATKMTVTLSFDSQIVSETSAAKFLQCFKDLIENPFMLVVSVSSPHKK